MATETDLVLLAKAQGLTPEQARTAGAIAWLESHGDPNAHNTNAATGDNSYGYWQINMLGDLGPTRRALLGLDNNEQLFDPQTNARAMRVLSSNGQDFSPWSTYKDGSAQAWMKTHLIQTEGGGPDQGQSTVGKIADALNPVDELKAFVDIGNKTARWVSNAENWVRVGYVVGGGALIVVGLVMMLQSTTLGSAVTQVIPAGRVASMVKKGASS